MTKIKILLSWWPYHVLDYDGRERIDNSVWNSTAVPLVWAMAITKAAVIDLRSEHSHKEKDHFRVI